MNKYLLTPDMEFMYTEVRILSKFSLVNQIVLLGLLTIVWVRGAESLQAAELVYSASPMQLS